MTQVHFPVARIAIALVGLHNTVGEDGYPDEYLTGMIEAVEAIAVLAKLYGDRSAEAITKRLMEELVKEDLRDQVITTR